MFGDDLDACISCQFNLFSPHSCVHIFEKCWARASVVIKCAILHKKTVFNSKWKRNNEKTLDRNQLCVTVIFHGGRFLLARLQVAMSFCAYGDQYLLIDKFHKSPNSDSVLTCPIFCITFEISQNGKWIAKTVHSAWVRRISNVNSDKRPE